MSIHFSQERWEAVRRNYMDWWRGELDRPLQKITVIDAYEPDRPKPAAPVLSQANCHDFSIPAEDLIDALDWQLSRMAFRGDAFPFVNFDFFGPSCLAGFCGAELHNETGNVWYMPKEKPEPAALHIRYDPENIYVRRIKELYRAAQARWGSSVLLGLPDLGGFQDVVANLLGTEETMFAMLEEPEEVLRLNEEAYEAFVAAYEDLNSVLMPVNPGYAGWNGLYCQEPTYILQDDFAYMISTDMFREFGMPEIRKIARKLPYVIYHLDGLGNLNHLEELLTCGDVNAIQWVYGAGQPGAGHWRHVYDRLVEAGRKIELVAEPEDAEALLKIYGGSAYHQMILSTREGM